MKIGQNVSVNGNKGKVSRTYNTEKHGKYTEVTFDTGRVTVYPAQEVRK